MKIRRKRRTGGVNPLLQLVVLVLAIGLVCLLAYRQISELVAPKRAVIVVSQTLKAGSVINEAHLRIRRLREDSVSAAALQDLNGYTGMRLVRDKEAGEPLYPGDFTANQGLSRTPLAHLVPEGRVVTTLTLSNRTIPYRELKVGDRIDILAAGRGADGSRSSAVCVRAAYVLGYLAPPPKSRKNSSKGLLGLIAQEGKDKSPPPGLMLAVFPAEVLPLARLDGSGAHMTLALHNPKTVEDGSIHTTQRIPSPHYVEVISGANRETVKLP